MRKEIVDFWQIMLNALPNLANKYLEQRSNEAAALIGIQKITVFLYNDNRGARNEIPHS